MYNYKCNLVKVVDGDTVDVDIDLGFNVVLHNQRVRLYGIDTPESRTSDEVEKKYGLLAKQRVEDFFNQEGLIELTTHEYNSKGKFGRILGDFVINGQSLCSTLILEHHAVAYNGERKEDITNGHLANRKYIDML